VKVQCAGTIKLGPRWPRDVRCSRSGVVLVDGSLYCRAHAPSIPRLEEDVYEDAIVLCACGCGEPVNMLLAVFRTLVADGFTHAETAEFCSVSREYVSRLLRLPPKYIKGHAARMYWKTAEAVARRDAWARTVSDRRAAGRSYWADVHERRLNRPLFMKKRRSRYDVITSIVSLDEPIHQYKHGGESVRHDVVAGREGSAEAIVLQQERNAALYAIAGDIGPDDVARMSESDRILIRERLIAAGISTQGVQGSERERLRESHRKSGTQVISAGSKPGGRKTQAQRRASAANHSIRDITGAQKKAHAARRKERA
jgi:hypothetical protein